MPAVKEFKAIKLTYEQAMAFDHKIKNFDELIAYYGADNRLSIGEHYDQISGTSSTEEVSQQNKEVAKIQTQHAKEYILRNRLKRQY